MQAIFGNFNMFRTRTLDGEDAILLVPTEPFKAERTEPFGYNNDALDESEGTITFEKVYRPGSDRGEDTFLTLRPHAGDQAIIHLGPDIQRAS